MNTSRIKVNILAATVYSFCRIICHTVYLSQEKLNSLIIGERALAYVILQKLHDDLYDTI